MLRIVPTYIVHAPNPVAHLSGQEPLALRSFALDLSNYFFGDMSSSCKQGEVSALLSGSFSDHTENTQRCSACCASKTTWQPLNIIM